MSGNVKSLSNHEAVTELLSLMRENGRKLEAMALSSMISSIDNIDRQYSELLSTTQDQRQQLIEATEQCRAVGGDPPDLNLTSYQVFQSEAEQVLAKVNVAQDETVAWAKDTVRNFELIGVSALDTTKDIVDIHNLLEALRKQARNSAWNMLACTETMGGQMISSIQAMRDKELSPLQAVRKLLSNDGELVSSYMCSPETAAEEFEISKKLYFQLTGRSQPVGRDVLMYRIIQSFKPGEISPEDANRIGYELAMKYTKGQHQFVVATHVDKAHIHTHIEINSTNLNCDGKLRDVKQSALVLRRLNDELCRAHGLSVIENPKPSAKKQKEMAATKYGTSHKEQLRQTIDRVLPTCQGYDDFLAKMRAEGYEIKEGKMLSFRAPGWDRFTRSSKLGSDYTKEVLRERSTTRRGRTAEAKKPLLRNGRKVNMLIDIQAKMAAGKGAGYERWAKVFNLKEAAKTLNFLVENGLTDYDELAARAEQAGDRFDDVSRRIKQLEARMAEVAQLKTHIINYSKTREIYAAYKKSRHKKEFLAEHGDEIAQHEAAKKAFDALGGKPIPKVAQLSQEYAALLAEKQEQYTEYKALRQDMIDYRTMKQNVDKILGLEPEEQTQQQEQTSER